MKQQFQYFTLCTVPPTVLYCTQYSLSTELPVASSYYCTVADVTVASQLMMFRINRMAFSYTGWVLL